jgi:hypothetical protein
MKELIGKKNLSQQNVECVYNMFSPSGEKEIIKETYLLLESTLYTESEFKSH